MSRTVTIHQPHYLPWIPYFDKILNSDIFVILDNVQFQKNGVQNRNQIKTQNGAMWLTVPVQHNFGQTIAETKIVDSKKVTKHLKTLEMAYKKSPCYEEVYTLIKTPLEANHSFLAELNIELMLIFLKYLGYNGKVVKASTLDVSGKGGDLVLDICRKLDADVYLSGQGARAYMDEKSFAEHGIKVIFQEYRNVEYPQIFSEQGFIKDLSIVDLLFNHGKESRIFIEKGKLS